MQFGHITDSLGEIDFTLPPDGGFTKKTFLEKKADGNLKIYIGAPKWGEKSWKGIIYPTKTPDKEFLRFYSHNFNTVEMGSTFYNLYSPEEVSRWTVQVGDSPKFKFCPKFPQKITHIRRLTNAEKETAQFYESLNGFGDKMGPLLLQLGDNFPPKSFGNLETYLKSLAPAIKVSVEVRSKKWFDDADARKALFSLFYDLNIGTVISDTTGRRDAIHMELTTTDAFIRFVGNNLDQTDYKRLNDWVERIAQWRDQGLQSLWFFMHQNNERFVPQACVYFINQLNAKLGTSIELPQIIGD